MTTSGVLTCYAADDGKVAYTHELGMTFNASPSLAGGRLYLLSTKGTMVICDAGDAYREIARCELGEEAFASPAFTDGRIYLRGKSSLFCIESPTKTEQPASP